MLIFYDILYICFLLCYLPLFLIKGKYHRGFLMRLGVFAQSAINKVKDKKTIWLHTVSVGEAQAASNLVKNLKREYPDFRLVISTVTETGNKIAQKLVSPEDLVIYFPLDIGFVVKRVIALINPQVFIVAETEIWPNVITNLAKKGTAVVLINGRISSGSFKGYKIIRPYLKELLQKFSLFCMQAEQDAQRIIELGADKNKVKITGNMKFDVQLSAFSPQLPALGLSEGAKLFIAGSTHGGEEKIILQIFKELVKSYSNLRLLIAPRHIERTQEIERLVSGFGFKPQRVSSISLAANYEQRAMNSVLILDTIGQLKSIYALAEIVFIGGSLIRRGGQNPIEPSVFSKPILFGSDMSNFSSVAEAFLHKGAAIMVKDAQQLKNNCSRLLESPELRKELGRKAKEVVRQNQGATLRNMELIKELIH